MNDDLQRFLDELRARLSIADVVGAKVKLTKKGREYQGLCPFHNEKTPSFTVNESKGFYHCFGCGAHGDIVKFEMEANGLPFMDAVQKLAHQAGLQMPHFSAKDKQEEEARKSLYDIMESACAFFERELYMPNGASGLKYFAEKRGLDKNTLKKFRLGYAPNNNALMAHLKSQGVSEKELKELGLIAIPEDTSRRPHDFFRNRVMIPITNKQGRIIAFGGRVMEKIEPKYLNSPDTPIFNKRRNLYNLDKAREAAYKEKKLIICEGYMDVIAYHQAGINIAVAPLGTAFTLEQIKLLRPFAGTILLSFDSDGAGQKATYKSILMCRTLDFEVKIIRLTQGKDPSEVLNNFGPESLKNCVESAIIDFDYLLDRGGSMYSCDTVQGKADLCRFIFPYVQALPSSVQKETALEKLSLGISVSYQALYQDFLKFIKGGGNPRLNSSAVTDGGNVRKKSGNPGITAELRGLLVVAVNLSYYEKLRSLLSPDDFEDDNARELFIAMEECYREDTLSYNSLLNHCKKQEVLYCLILF